MDKNKELSDILFPARDVRPELNDLVCSKICYQLQKFFVTGNIANIYSECSFPYPQRQDSLLKLITDTGNIHLLKKVYTTLFKNDEERYRFLCGKSSCGQSLNYHYFEKDLSPRIRANAIAFYDKQKSDALRRNPDLRTKEQKKQEEMYLFIRDEKLRLFDVLSENDDNFFEKNSRLEPQKHSFSDDLSSMNVVFEGPEKNFVLKQKKEKFMNLGLFASENKNFPDRMVCLKNMSYHSNIPFSKQAFFQIDFPEVFSSFAGKLDRLQKHIREISEDVCDFSALMEKENSLLIVADKEAFDDSNVLGFFSEDNAIFINGDLLNNPKTDLLKEILKHEATHLLDYHFPLSSNNFFELCTFVAFQNKKNNSERKDLVEEVKEGYPFEDYGCEVLARLLSLNVSENDKIFAPLRDISKHCLRAHILDNKAILNRYSNLSLESIRYGESFYKASKNALNFENLSWFQMLKTSFSKGNPHSQYKNCLRSFYGSADALKLEEHLSRNLLTTKHKMDLLAQKPELKNIVLSSELCRYENIFIHEDNLLEEKVLNDWNRVTNSGKHPLSLTSFIKQGIDESQKCLSSTQRFATLLAAYAPMEMLSSPKENLFSYQKLREYKNIYIPKNPLVIDAFEEALKKDMSVLNQQKIFYCLAQQKVR